MKRELIMTAGLALLALTGCHHKDKAKHAEAAASEAAATTSDVASGAASDAADAGAATTKK